MKQERILTRDTTSSNGTFQPTLCDQQQLQNMVVRQLSKNVIQAEQHEEAAKTGAAVKQERIPTRDTTSSNGTFQPTVCDQQQFQNMMVRQMHQNVTQAEQHKEAAKTGAAVKQERIPTRRSS